MKRISDQLPNEDLEFFAKLTNLKVTIHGGRHGGALVWGRRTERDPPSHTCTTMPGCPLPSGCNSWASPA